MNYLGRRRKETRCLTMKTTSHHMNQRVVQKHERHDTGRTAVFLLLCFANSQHTQGQDMPGGGRWCGCDLLPASGAAWERSSDSYTQREIAHKVSHRVARHTFAFNWYTKTAGSVLLLLRESHRQDSPRSAYSDTFAGKASLHSASR